MPIAANTYVRTSIFADAVRTCLGATVLALALSPWVLEPAYADDGELKNLEAVHQVERQLEELQMKVKELEAKLEAANRVARLESAAYVPRESSHGLPPSTPQKEDAQEENSPTVKLRLFGDVGYEVSDQKNETNSFHVGTLDLLMTGALSERVSVLGELLFIPRQNNGIETDVERLLLQYKHSDHFTVAIGRYHSSIGYYNTAYHQGAWFQTTFDRPFMYAFDDHGGFLPLQEVGITISGQVPSGRLGLNYVAELGNGRAHLLGSDPAQNFQDTNNGKSVNFALFARPGWVPGLQVGFSIYHDYLTFSDNDNHDELISTVHLVFKNSKYEFLNEAMLVRHSRAIGGGPGTFHPPGFYAQVSRRFGRYRPYFRYSYVNAGVAEPIYGDPADGPVVGRRNGPSVGLRFDVNDHAAFKLQYDHLGQRRENSFNALETQFSLAF